MNDIVPIKKPKAAAQTTTGLNGAQIAMLTQKSPKELIRTRIGSNGKTLSYLPHNFVTEILNQAFNFAWDFQTDVVKIDEKECIVKGRLVIHSQPHITKEQYGCQLILKGMATGDALKGAGSDALRKCASLLGIGLDLYGAEHHPDEEIVSEWQLNLLDETCERLCLEQGVDVQDFKKRLDSWVFRKWGINMRSITMTQYEGIIKHLTGLVEVVKRELNN